MKKQPTITVHMPEDLFRRMLYLCEAEHRTPNNEITLLLRNSVQYFERAKGRMDTAKLAAYDLTPYLQEEEE
jgi:hypothetical protein